MTRSFFSPSWYRVAMYRPRLRSHASIHRHHYRGQLWYVLQDRTSGRFHRFTPETYRIVAMMDGRRTVDEIWETACEQLREDAITQDEMIRLLGRLHAADVLYGDVPPDIAEVSERGRRTRRQKLVKSVLNPLAIRVPVIDPDDFLTATMPLVRLFYSIFGFLLFAGVIGYGAVLVVLNWQELTDNVVDRVLAAQNLVLLLVSYPLIKALHELGHAYTIKRWGGHVHEIGLMFLVFMPVPYVDASDSLAFHSKWRRALVGSAGIIVELFLAAIAMFVWVNAEDGLLRAFAFNVMLIGGVSTLLFNGNPLLRFDGYYVLSDLLEIPNLGQRANQYIGYLVQRHAFAMKDAENPVTAPGEGKWLFLYAVTSFPYRVMITFAIVFLVSKRFFFVGLVLALWALFLMLVFPAIKQLWFLFTSPVLRNHRGRALAATGSLALSLLAILFAVPLPYNAVAEGVVAAEGPAVINSGADGVIAEVYVEPGQIVAAGDPILRLDDPLQDSRLRTYEARIAELTLRVQSETLLDPAAAKIYREELIQAQGDLADARARSAALIARAAEAGKVILPLPQDLVGHFVRRGETVAHVSNFHDPLIRVVVPEAQADVVRRQTAAVAVRFAADTSRVWPARVVREAPSLTRILPDAALATEGGGPIPLEPGGERELRSVLNFLTIDLRLEEAPEIESYGDRVYVRFSLGSEPIAARLYRGGMQVFLRFLNV